jgi:hypothetical protein
MILCVPDIVRNLYYLLRGFNPKYFSVIYSKGSKKIGFGIGPKGKPLYNLVQKRKMSL